MELIVVFNDDVEDSSIAFDDSQNNNHKVIIFKLENYKII